MKNTEDVARPTQGFGATVAAADHDDGGGGFSTITTCLFTLLCLHMNFWVGGMKRHSIPSLVTTQVPCHFFLCPKTQDGIKGKKI